MHPLLNTTDEFHVPGTHWHLDARLPRSHAVISHAHSDHIGRHHRVIATPVTCALLRHRLAEPGETGTAAPLEPGADSLPMQLTPLAYATPHLDGAATIELFSAGHVLGSAMTRVTTPRGRLLYTGDFRFKRDALTVPPCQIPSDGADAVLMECTYGLSRYRFPERTKIIEQLCDTLAAAQAQGKQPVCLCYSLGKAQEIGRLLIDNGFAVSMHGAAHAITAIYQSHGMRVGAVLPSEAGAIEGAVLIAPPHIRNSRMIASLKKPHISVITGWALDGGCKYRYQADAAFPISDHADFDELNAFVDALAARGAKEFLLTHGFVKEFGRHLRSRGFAARPARPPAQLALFED